MILHACNKSPIYWKEAISFLVRKDRILKKLIPSHKNSFLPIKKDPFFVLTRLIIGQQISVKNADKIWRNFLNQFHIDPYSILHTNQDKFEKIGIPQRKINYLYGLASHFYEKKINPEKWVHMEDDSIISDLSSIKGIGRWTAEMFLIFSMQRPDVMPLDDSGLLKSISIHYFSGEPVSRFEAREVSLAWKPWRTVASLYLWHSLDLLPESS